MHTFEKFSPSGLITEATKFHTEFSYVLFFSKILGQQFSNELREALRDALEIKIALGNGVYLCSTPTSLSLTFSFYFGGKIGTQFLTEIKRGI